MIWEILDTGTRSAEENMRIDAELLESLGERTRPLLHLYEWEKDSATYGYFLKPSYFLNLEQAQEKGLELARRSTGGGIVFHLWDMAFSALVPAHLPECSSNTLENYAFINQAVLAAAQEFLRETLRLTPTDFAPKDPHCSFFCMAKPTKYDVVFQGRKIAGAAQRKTKGGFLHQGTISLVMPSEEYLSSILLPNTEVLFAMKSFTQPLLGFEASLSDMREAKQNLRALLATHLNHASLKYSLYGTQRQNSNSTDARRELS